MLNVNIDSLSLMRQLAKMAGVDLNHVRRMVLVAELNAVPVLYTENYVKESGEPLPNVDLRVEADTPVTVKLDGGLEVDSKVPKVAEVVEETEIGVETDIRYGVNWVHFSPSYNLGKPLCGANDSLAPRQTIFYSRVTCPDCCRVQERGPFPATGRG